MKNRFKMVTHIMHFYDGADNEYYGGEWNITETPTMYKLELLSDERDYGNFNNPKESIRKDMKSKSRLLDWGDGSYTVYPNRNGIPHVFAPITAADINREFDED